MHRFCIHNGKRKLELATVSVNLVLLEFVYIRWPVFILFYEYILENVEKNLQSDGFREGRSGYSKYTFFFFA